MSYLPKRSSHPLSCNGDSSSEDDVFVNSKLDVYADYYDKPNPHSYFVDLYDPECVMTDNYNKQNKQTISALFSPRSPGTPRGENDAIIFTIKFCGKNFGEVGLFEPDISVLDWEGFRMYLFTSLNLENPESFVIYYSDEETDKIPIESEAEYKEALKIAKYKSTRQEKFVLDINRNTIGFPSLRSLVTSSIRRVNSVGSSVKAIPGPVPEKKDVTTSTSFSSLWGSLESLSIKTDRSELSEESDGLEMTTIHNSQSITPLNFIIDIDRNDCVIKRIMPTKENCWSRLGIKTYKVGYFEYNSKYNRDNVVIGARPLQHIGQAAAVGKLMTRDGTDRPITNNSGRKDEVSFYCTFYCHLDQLEKPEALVLESPIEFIQEQKEPKVVEDQNAAPFWFKNSMQQLKEEMSQEISSKINERFEDLVGNFNVKDVEERLRGVIKGYGSDVQERVICCCKGKECKRMPSLDEFATSRLSVESEVSTGQNLWNVDLLKEELEKREKEILSCIDSTNEKIKSKILYNELQRPSSNSQSNEDYIKERERVLTRIEDFRQRQSKLFFTSLKTPTSSKAEPISKSESFRNGSPTSPGCADTRLNFTESDLADFKAKTSSDHSDTNAVPSGSEWSDSRHGWGNDGHYTSNFYNLENSPPLKAVSYIVAKQIPPTTTTGPLDYDAKFISDEDFPDGAVVPPGVVISKSWMVMNTGTKSWDRKTWLFCSNYDSNPLVPYKPTYFCPELKPGEVARIKVDLVTPRFCGNDFVTKWKFAHNGTIFGNMLWCKIQVQLPSESVCRVKSLAESQPDKENVIDSVKDNNLLDRRPSYNDTLQHPTSSKCACETKALLAKLCPTIADTNSDLIDEIDNNVTVNLGKQSRILELYRAEQNKGVKDQRDLCQILVDILKSCYAKEQWILAKEEESAKEQERAKEEQERAKEEQERAKEEQERAKEEQDSPSQSNGLEICGDDKDENFEDIEDSDEENDEKDYEDSDGSSGYDFSEDELLSDEHERDLDEDDEFENDTPCEYEKEVSVKEEKQSSAFSETPVYQELETSTDSIEIKERLLSKEKYQTEVLDILGEIESIEIDENFEKLMEETCSMEVPEVYEGTEGDMTMSEVESTVKESELEEEYQSDDDSSDSCKVEESSSESDTQLQLLKATLNTAVAPEESLAAELAAAAFEDTSVMVADVKENSQSSEESPKKKSALQEHFKQNVEVNLDFEVISHSNNREESPFPDARELTSGQGCPLTFKERHFTISHLPPPNPTTVPDSDDEDSYDGLVFIRPEDVPSSAPETPPGTPSASEDHRSNQEFPLPSESERSVTCSSLSDYKNADDEDSDNDNDSESCSSFSGVEEEDLAEAAATGDNGSNDLSPSKGNDTIDEGMESSVPDGKFASSPLQSALMDPNHFLKSPDLNLDSGTSTSPTLLDAVPSTSESCDHPIDAPTSTLPCQEDAVEMTNEEVEKQQC